MKKSFFTTLVVLGLIIFFNGFSFAQWQPEVRMTNDPTNSYTSFGNGRCIATSGNYVHIVWYDGGTVGEGNWEVFYKRSTDRGVTWEPAVNLTNDEFIAYNPVIAVAGATVHVSWYDNSNAPGNYEIFYKRSLDNGATWDATVQLSNTLGRAGHPSIFTSGINVHIAWWDTRDGNFEIYYKRSVDNGNTWTADTRLSNTAGPSYNPAIAVSGSNVHVIWFDSTAGNWEIYYKRSIDGGLNWGADTRLTNNSARSWAPTLVVSGSMVHIAWMDERDGSGNIYYKRSTNSGNVWGADTRLTKGNYLNNYPSLAVYGSNVHLTFERLLNTSFDIIYLTSKNDGGRWGNEVQLTSNSSASNVSSIAVSGTYLHTVFRDTRDGNTELYYKQFKGSVYATPNGISDFDPELPDVYSLKQNYPNPFNPVTTISYDIPEQNLVTITVFDLLGREIAKLVNEVKSPGKYFVNFNASDLNSGIYFYKLTSGKYSETKKMSVIK